MHRLGGITFDYHYLPTKSTLFDPSKLRAKLRLALSAMDLIGYVIERLYKTCYLLTRCIPLEKSSTLPPPPLLGWYTAPQCHQCGAPLFHVECSPLLQSQSSLWSIT